MNYAITINQRHDLYGDIDFILELLKRLDFSYIEIVNHSNDHYHGLVSTNRTLKEMIDLKLCHVEIVRNTKAYQKYMHDHDKTDERRYGELGYQENDSIVDSVINIGAVATVQKYGMQALRYYKQLKEFENDYRGENVFKKSIDNSK